MGYNWTLKEGAGERIYQRIAPIAMRTAARDHLDLPELVHNTIKVTLPPAAMLAYRKMEAVLITEVNSKIITAANAAAASVKCRQMANGGVYVDGVVSGELARPTVLLHNAKVDALCDLIEELQGNPLLVAYEFHHDLAAIQKALGPVPFVGGGVSPKKGKEILDAWSRAEVPVLCVNPASAAWGLNLQGKMQHICWFALPWNLEFHDQLIARIWRQGSEAKVVMSH